MNYVKTYEEYEQLPVSSERTLPAVPYPRTYIHGVLDDLYDAVQAVHALRSMDFDPGDIHVMASWDFVEAVGRKQQRQNRLAKLLMRFRTFLDEGIGGIYMYEALRGTISWRSGFPGTRRYWRFVMCSLLIIRASSNMLISGRWLIYHLLPTNLRLRLLLSKYCPTTQTFWAWL